MGDKTIPDSAEPRLEAFYPPFVAGIDLPHQGVVDSYNPSLGMRQLFGDVTIDQWRHNRPNYVTIRVNRIYVHINTQNKESLTQRCRRSTNVQLHAWYFCTYPYGLSLNVWYTLLCIANNRHGVTITTHAIKRHFLIWMTTVRQPTKRRRSCVLTLKYIFICVYWWTRQRIHNTLIAVDRYLRLMGDKTIPHSAEPRLESFYPPFVAGIDLPHQGVVDSYNPCCNCYLSQCHV